MLAKRIGVARLAIRLFGTPRFSFDGAPWCVTVPSRCT
jgi:hypothetical protein